MVLSGKCAGRMDSAVAASESRLPDPQSRTKTLTLFLSIGLVRSDQLTETNAGIYLEGLSDWSTTHTQVA